MERRRIGEDGEDGSEVAGVVFAAATKARPAAVSPPPNAPKQQQPAVANDASSVASVLMAPSTKSRPPKLKM